MRPPPAPALLARFAAIVGPAHALTDPAATAPYRREWRGRHHGVSPLVLRPGRTAEVAAILALANETGTAIVPQGGNTGLVGGQIPLAGEVVLALGRLDRIRAVDAAGGTMTAEAGVILADARQAAESAGLRLPLTLAAEGSAQIGGTVATNAGGTAVLAYGSMRAQVLGLEVVLADGRVWDGLRALRKDNAGYDLKHLFIGSEGTLGIITAAVLRLVPRPAAEAVGIAGIAGPEAALALLAAAQAAFGPRLTAFELMPRFGLDLALRHLPGTRDPLAAAHPWYVLIEAGGPEAGALAAETERLLAGALANGTAADAVLAADAAQAAAFWHLRHGLSEAQKREGASLKHDVAVPVAAVPAFLAEAAAAARALVPGGRPVPFGHLGDGSIHFNVTAPPGTDSAVFLARGDAMAAAVHRVVARLGGSIAAEHGIGAAKAHLLPGVRSPVEMDLMRALKRTLDPKGILNPGKVLAAPD